MQDLLAGLEASAVATWLRQSRFAYPIVNILHLLGLAALFGAILPLDLRLMGLWRDAPLAPLARVLRPVAAAGLALAAATGLLLFSVAAREYAAAPLFWGKAGLITLGVANALALGGPRLDAASATRRRAAGVASLLLWTGAISAGRWLGYL